MRNEAQKTIQCNIASAGKTCKGTATSAPARECEADVRGCLGFTRNLRSNRFQGTVELLPLQSRNGIRQTDQIDGAGGSG